MVSLFTPDNALGKLNVLGITVLVYEILGVLFGHCYYF